MSPTRFPCSANQEQWLKSHRSAVMATALNSVFHYRLDGPATFDAIVDSFHKLIDRHEILRTRFIETGGAHAQEVLARVSMDIPFIDYSDLDTEAAEARSSELGSQSAAIPFDVTSPPLIRLTVAKMGPTRFDLHICAHAIILDLWSLSILVTELGCLIAAQLEGAPSALPSVDMHYGDYASWQDAMAASSAYDKDLDYWQSELAGVGRFAIAPTKQPPAFSRHPNLTRGVRLPAALMEAASAVARTSGVTLQHVVLAALAALLARRTGLRDVILGTQHAGRQEEQAEKIVGPLANIVVIRIAAAFDQPLSALIDQAARKSFDASLHQGVPFASVSAALAPVGSLAGSPIFNINFSFQSAFVNDDQLSKSFGPVTIQSLPSNAASALCDLSFFLVERPDGWRMSCAADADLYDSDFVEGLLTDWTTSLNCIVNEPHLLLRDLPVGTREPLPLETSTVEFAPFSSGLAEDRFFVHNPQASGVPVFALYLSSIMYHLATLLPSRPLIDIDLAADTSPNNLSFRPIPDMATDVLNLIKKAYPRGPYILLGHCIFGSLAFEIARQLMARDDEVALLVMIDTWAPGYREDLPPLANFSRKVQVALHRHRLSFAQRREGRVKLQTIIKSEINLIRWRLRSTIRRQCLLGNLNHTQIDKINWRELYTDQMYLGYRSYRPRNYFGRTLIFRAEQVCSGKLFPLDLGWSKYLFGEYEIVEFPGSHNDALYLPGVATIAQRIEESLKSLDIMPKVTPNSRVHANT